MIENWEEFQSSNTSDEELGIDHMLEINRNIDLLDAPKLSRIEYFCYASHILFVDSNYSISDATRINEVCNEVKVTHQNSVREIINYCPFRDFITLLCQKFKIHLSHHEV